jgi:hypothetical protein
MIGLGSKHIVNAFNLWVVVFVALGTLSTAYGLAIIGSTVGQPNCKRDSQVMDFHVPSTKED